MSQHESTPTPIRISRAFVARGESAPASGALPFILGSMLLGTIGIFVHEAKADPITATWFRCAFGLIGLTLWFLIRREAGRLRVSMSTAPWLLGAAMLMVLAWALYFAAIGSTSAGVASVLFHMQPLWVLVLGAWLLKEHIAKRRIVSVMAAMVGLVLATGLADRLDLSGLPNDKSLTTDYLVGILFCVVGAFCTACVTIIAKRIPDTPAGVLAWWQCAVGALALLAWPIAHGWPSSMASWAWLSGLGLIHTGLAYTLMYAGIGRLSTDRIAVLQFIYPAMVIVLDWLLYGQSLGILQVVGIGVMAVAILFAERPGTSSQSAGTCPRMAARTESATKRSATPAAL